MEALAGEHQGTTTVAEDAAIARENAEQCIEEGLVDIRHSIYLDAGLLVLRGSADARTGSGLTSCSVFTT